MPRKNRICPEVNAFHIYIRSNNRVSFGLNQEQLWGIFSDYLFFIYHGFNSHIHAFSLMSNHIHILCSFPDRNLSSALHYFMKETSRRINLERKSMNHVFGGRFKSTLIQDPVHFAIAYKYVLQNPLRSKLTRNLYDYKFTSVAGIYGNEQISIPVVKHFSGLDQFIPDYGSDHLEWLHEEYSEKDISLINKALNKNVFKFPKENSTGKHQVVSENFSASHPEKLPGTF